MQLFNYIEINLFAFMMLFVIFLNMRRNSERYLFDQKLFLTILGSNALMLILDTIMWSIDGRSGFLARQTNLFVTTINYIFNTVPSMLWSFYADFQIHRDSRRFRKMLVPLLIPVSINAILAILSFFYGFMFYIDENNVYHRGNLFLIMATICYLYLLGTFIQIIVKRNIIKKSDYLSLLIFALPPFVGGIVQSIFYGISVTWICLSVSLLIVFINIQNNQLYTDYLTGLYNRRQLDNYLTNRVRSNIGDKLLAGIMIDINYFKEINDLYGHVEGDRALEYTGRIIKNSFRKDDFVARYGGDEFAIIIEINKKSELENIVNRLRENVKEFNARRITTYNISLSIGYDVFDDQSEMTVHQFLKHIDSLMYEDKKSKAKKD